MAQIWPAFVALLKVAPSMPAYTDADDTPGVPSTIGMICCTTASVRARLVPGGIVSETATSFWSCAGTKPRGVSITRQAVSTSKPAYSAHEHRAVAQRSSGEAAHSRR